MEGEDEGEHAFGGWRLSTICSYMYMYIYIRGGWRATTRLH